MSAPYALNEPLPPEVLRRHSRGVGSYKNYPAFSFPWLWRRTCIFGTIAIVLASLNLSSVYLLTRDAGVTGRTAPLAFGGFLLFVIGGPLLATVLRHYFAGARAERVLVLSAIVVGVLLSMMAQLGADAFSKEVILKHITERGLPNPAAGIKISPLAEGINRVAQLTLFFVLGGGLALRTYFQEQFRWHEHVQAREIDVLRAERDAAQRRLLILQAQVEPHFLFNTLASARSLIARDPARAEAAIDALVTYLRAILPRMRSSTGDQQSTLGDQVDLCRSYLDVVRVRMEDRLSYTIDVPANLRDRPFPPLILISLVENAIKHGVEPKPGHCDVTISAGLRKDNPSQFEVVVADTGAGLKVGMGGGVGLSNIRAQLAALYGDHAGLSLESRPEEGVIARLHLPAGEPAK
jgi:two-component sensor histidine kinase